VLRPGPGLPRHRRHGGPSSGRKSRRTSGEPPWGPAQHWSPTSRRSLGSNGVLLKKWTCFTAIQAMSLPIGVAVTYTFLRLMGSSKESLEEFRAAMVKCTYSSVQPGSGPPAWSLPLPLLPSEHVYDLTDALCQSW
jgi:hypothetical protein